MRLICFQKMIYIQPSIHREVPTTAQPGPCKLQQVLTSVINIKLALSFAASDRLTLYHEIDEQNLPQRTDRSSRRGRREWNMV